MDDIADAIHKVIENIEELRNLDHKAIRDYKRRALNFNLDIRPPERRPGTSGAPGGGRRLVELKEIVREKLAARPLETGEERLCVDELRLFM